MDPKFRTTFGRSHSTQKAKIVITCFLLFPLLLSNCLQGNGKKEGGLFFLPSGFTVVEQSGGSNNPPSVLAPTPPPSVGSIAYSSASTIYLSGQSGAVEFADVLWSSSKNAFYELRSGSTDCTNGTIETSGAISASTSVTSRIHAVAGVVALNLGDNDVRICLKSPDGSSLWDSHTVRAVRDDTAPSVSFTPAAGSYGSSVPSVTISCSDTGNSGCHKTAFRSGGTAASIANDGTAASGNTIYSSAISLTNNTTTDLSAIAVDKAGNVGSAVSATYVVSVGNPTITIVSLSKSVIKGSASSVLKWKSDIAGNYSIRLGGTDCSSGTSLTTGSVAANTDTDYTVLGSDLSSGSNDVRICVTTAGSNVGNNSASITRDDAGPQIIAVSPALSPNTTAYALSTGQRTFSITFNEDMDTTSSPNPKHIDQTTSPEPEINWIGGSGTWSSDKRTYTLDLKSKLPEWHKFYLKYTSASFTDVAGNVMVTSPTVAVTSGAFRLDYGTANDTSVLLPSGTRQTTCSDSTGTTISCAGTGQDAEISALPFGLIAPGTLPGYPSDVVTLDTRNLRYWKTCLSDYEWSAGTCVKICPMDQFWNGTACVADAGNPYKTFNRSVEDCSGLNNRNSGNGYAGKKTWRVPTLAEYYTILEFGGTVGNETIPETFFPGLLRNNYQRYWTSTNAITISSSNRYTRTPSIDALSNGPINYSGISSLQSWGAWSISVFGGVTQPNNKLKDVSWTGGGGSNYNFTSMCVAE
ncbi:DUF1566 domain-containing protein [Leptospira gomenensis]|uniref:DUF1566 domain-containing protein n=1 Tax=Leptospira gomenensis TaxID=2484974 RepID=A0A5F1YZ90_9LEPT|nr:DUF1566 domain-containing protein [Leptospira gomenensis]TGK39206.1 DUF1566 domain-containing protein [Leptospira gomenensis]TGK44253.1 DUF1566 domain-containing protein [Leptospira gomenensis]TGK45077.1 DUF1566 domain-containing protein [Leptospira gomenensis]TGK65115.1 DUF1566 domain-containing protein [Leptospira gomenensis]